MNRAGGLPLACALVALSALHATAAAAADPDFASCRASAVLAQRLHAAQSLLEERDELLKCLRPECPDVIQDSCRRWLEENRQARPSVVVVAKDPDGNDLVGASFSVDGGAARQVDGKPLELDPGTHRFEGRAAALGAVRLEVVVAIGVKLRPITIAWPRDATRPSARAALDAAPETRPVPTRVYVLGGAAAAALGTAAIFGALAWRQYDALRARGSGDQQPLPTFRAVGDVALGLGVVLAGLTLWQYLARPTATRQFAQSSW